MTKISGRPNVEEIRRVAIQIIRELKEEQKCQ